MVLIWKTFNYILICYVLEKSSIHLNLFQTNNQK